eukprot:10817313-Alexandrium_andersonii.AAC.1
MSASLVGSEMCIRDRPPPPPRSPGPPRPRRCSPGWASARSLGRAPDQHCLLYTSDAADDM